MQTTTFSPPTHAVLKLAFLGASLFAFSSGDCRAQPTKAEQISAWRAEVLFEREDLGEKYSQKAARLLQQKEFEEGGVGMAQMYSDSWGDWVYMASAEGLSLHTRLRDTLNRFALDLTLDRPLPPDTMSNLADRMEAFREGNGQMRRLLSARLQLNVNRALELDQLHAAQVAHALAVAANSKLTAAVLADKIEGHRKLAEQWAKDASRAGFLIACIGNSTQKPEFKAEYAALLEKAGMKMR